MILEHKSHLRQLLASLVAGLGSFSAGCGLAWPSVGLRGLEVDDVELGAAEESQLVSVFLLAAAALWRRRSGRAATARAARGAA